MILNALEGWDTEVSKGFILNTFFPARTAFKFFDRICQDAIVICSRICYNIKELVTRIIQSRDYKKGTMGNRLFLILMQ